MRTKLTAVLTAALLPLLASAGEIVPGTIQISGASTLSLASGSIKETTKVPGSPDVTVDTDTSAFGFDVGGLYYLTDMVGVGLDIGYESLELKTPPVTITTSDLFIGPKVGLDIGVAEKIALFGDLAIGYVSESFEETDAGITITHEPSGWGLRIGAGVKYFPVKSLSLDAGLTYRYTSVSVDHMGVTTDTKTGGIGGLIGISVYIGN